MRQWQTVYGDDRAVNGLIVGNIIECQAGDNLDS